MAKRPTKKTTSSETGTPKTAAKPAGVNGTPPARSRKTARSSTTAPKRARAGAKTEVRAPSSEEIAARAYELFAARGYEHGHDLEDWLRAEADLRAR